MCMLKAQEDLKNGGEALRAWNNISENPPNICQHASAITSLHGCKGRMRLVESEFMNERVTFRFATPPHTALWKKSQRTV